jgi:4,5-DOPA dioxygenase extradiol
VPADSPRTPTPASQAPAASAAELGSERRARSDRAPALFLAHGSPLAVMNEPYKMALRRFGAKLRDPRGLVVVSSHWHAMRPLRATGSRSPTLLRDYEGFPAWTDSLTWRCQGAPALADEVVDLLRSAGIGGIVDLSHGIDSAVWVPLSLMFPVARSPVVQVSLPMASSPADVRDIGRALTTLRNRGVMVVGCGDIVHNESRARFDRHDPPTEPWAVAFDNWVRDQLEIMDEGVLLDYRRGPHAHLAAPTSEFIDPLFFVLGARQIGDRAVQIYEGFHAGNLSLRTFALLGKRATDERLPDELTAGAAA